MIVPEEYDEYGEIIIKPEPVVYERSMGVHDKHRIHQTKDMFDSNCDLCNDDAKHHRQTYWDEQT